MKQKHMSLAAKAIRERCVRQGFLEPRTDEEKRQAEEGPVPNSELDCFKD